jgi:hypothetical protein
MPKAYKFTYQDFLEFKEKILKEGFRQIEPYEFYTELQVADVERQTPTPTVGREEGFIFSALGLEVRVWTSFIMSKGEVRTPDSGWIVIREHGGAKYFAPQMYRTKNFFKRMLLWTRICRERIQARPVCHVCRQRYMSIVHGKHYQYYWKCTDPIHWQKFEKPPCKPWDTGLSVESLKIVHTKRETRRKYNLKRRKLGKPGFGTARKNRKPWKKKSSPVAHAM